MTSGDDNQAVQMTASADSTSTRTYQADLNACNYAMLLLIASYGLRGCEVRALRLNDRAWSTSRQQPSV
jgi:integrase